MFTNKKRYKTQMIEINNKSQKNIRILHNIEKIKI